MGEFSSLPEFLQRHFFRNQTDRTGFDLLAGAWDLYFSFFTRVFMANSSFASSSARDFRRTAYQLSLLTADRNAFHCSTTCRPRQEGRLALRVESESNAPNAIRRIKCQLRHGSRGGSLSKYRRDFVIRSFYSPVNPRRNFSERIYRFGIIFILEFWDHRNKTALALQVACVSRR